MINKRILSALGGLHLAYRGFLKRVNIEGGVQMTQVSGLASETHAEVEFFQQSTPINCSADYPDHQFQLGKRTG
ncbi:phage baseplate assembly protein [Serratia symbiotica]|nr:phage baseplate assembly protein [Serratia symbiotica]